MWPTAGSHSPVTTVVGPETTSWTLCSLPKCRCVLLYPLLLVGPLVRYHIFHGPIAKMFARSFYFTKHIETGGQFVLSSTFTHLLYCKLDYCELSLTYACSEMIGDFFAMNEGVGSFTWWTLMWEERATLLPRIILHLGQDSFIGGLLSFRRRFAPAIGL